MRVLALEPFYGGSHQAFLDGWSAHSRHDFDVIGLEPRKWKWRMRHAAVTFAYEVQARLEKDVWWDIVFCSDMLNLAEFKGLADEMVSMAPTVVYFHENQLTYPVRVESERDLQFGFTNLTTALAAEQVWFNSAYHRREFLDATLSLWRRMPDHNETAAIENLDERCYVHYPGIPIVQPPARDSSRPMHIVWVARWEHDKNPEDFFAALIRLKETEIPFRLSVLGEQFEEVPAVFESARATLQENTLHWGYQRDRGEFERILSTADVVVSTANHEFFGIAILEAIAAGAYPLLPERLSYPELLQLHLIKDNHRFFYDGSIDALVARLQELAENRSEGVDLLEASRPARIAVSRFFWIRRAMEMDDALESAAH